MSSNPTLLFMCALAIVLGASSLSACTSEPRSQSATPTAEQVVHAVDEAVRSGSILLTRSPWPANRGLCVRLNPPQLHAGPEQAGFIRYRFSTGAAFDRPLFVDVRPFEDEYLFMDDTVQLAPDDVQDGVCTAQIEMHSHGSDSRRSDDPISRWQIRMPIDFVPSSCDVVRCDSSESLTRQVMAGLQVVLRTYPSGMCTAHLLWDGDRSLRNTVTGIRITLLADDGEAVASASAYARGDDLWTMAIPFEADDEAAIGSFVESSRAWRLQVSGDADEALKSFESEIAWTGRYVIDSDRVRVMQSR